MPEPPRACDDPSCCGDGAPREIALRELGRFSQSWSLGRLIEPAPGERLSRRQMDRRLVERAQRDRGVLAELREHPRWVYMVAVFEAFGFSKLRFLEQVREVRLLEETAECLYLVLPARVGLQQRIAAAASRGDEPTSPREAVEAALVARAGAEPRFRDELLFRPQLTYRRAAGGPAGSGPEPGYLRGVREVRVVPETTSSLALALPVAAPA